MDNNMMNNQVTPNGTDKSQISMICGIVAVVLSVIGCFCCIGYASVPVGIIAIVMAVMSKNENNGEFTKNAKIGLILGIVSIVLLVVAFIASFALGLSAGFAEVL